MLIPIKIIKNGTKIDFVAKAKYCVFFSFILLMFVLIGISTLGMNFGVDFKGGILIEMQSNNSDVNVDIVRKVLNENLEQKNFDVKEVIRTTSTSSYDSNLTQANLLHTPKKSNTSNISIRISEDSLDKAKINQINEKITSQNIENTNMLDIDNSDTINNNNRNSSVELIENIKNILRKKIDKNIEFEKVDFVGPKISESFVFDSIKAIMLALVVMMIYTWWRFNLVFGIGVVVALLHDIIATFGFYILTRYEVDFTSVAALLTIVGYSINDSVVIYDRIRENLQKFSKKKIYDIINLSINETLSRTIMTVSTTVIVCLVIAIFGGETLRGFALATCFGIVFGTYSSIYISAPILALFSKSKFKILAMISS